MINGAPRDRTPPNDPQAEQSILGYTMTRGHIPAEAKTLQPDDFYQPNNEIIWHTIQQLAKQNKPCTYIAVRAHLQENGQLDSRGGIPSQTIVELTTTPTAEDPAHLTEILHDRSLRRQIIALHERGLQHAYTSADPAHNQLDYTQKQLETVTIRHHPENQLLTGIRTADWLAAQIFPPLKWVVPGLLPEGMSLLIGAPKIGKSWLSLSIALAVAHGGYALGKIHVGHPRPVLLLALEDSHRRLQNRIQKLLEGEPFPPYLHYLTDLKPDQLIPTIEAWLDQQPPNSTPLVILDTLGKVMPPTMPNESQYQRDYRIAGQLKHTCDTHHPGTALLVLHHDRKTVTDDFVDSVSGTNGIAGAADTIMVIQRPRNETTGLIKITGRDVEEAEYAAEITDGNWTLIGGDLAKAAEQARIVHATVNLGDRSADIVKFVADHPEGARADAVADALDMSPDDAGKYLRRLHGAGRLEKLGRGLFGQPGVDPPLSETSEVSDLSVKGGPDNQQVSETQTDTQTDTLPQTDTPPDTQSRLKRTHNPQRTGGIRVARDTTPIKEWEPKTSENLTNFNPRTPCPICGKALEDPAGSAQCVDNHPEDP